MVKKILVPLDRTSEAESVVSVVDDIARGATAAIRLLHVAPVPDNVVDLEGRVVAYADQETARLEAEARDYLRSIEARLNGATVESVVRFGEPVTEILQEAESFGADMITLTAGHRHHHGLKGLILGTTAAQVCRRTDLPVLVLRPGPPP